ncbi:MAG TPA: DPP IV N-terminal domain-containing protein [Bacteroidia bacterium]|nr:DPP IV N-terminal domain-containing protein [Bacteroidia bacterium]
MKYRILLLLLLPLVLQAQNKKLTLENCVFASRDSLIPQRLTQLGWIKGTPSYYFIENKNGKQSLVSVNAEKENTTVILTLDQLNEKIKALQLRAVNEIKTFPFIVWTSSTSFIYNAGNYTATYNTSDGRLTMAVKPAYSEKADRFDEAVETGYVAYTVGNNLWVNKNGTLTPVTKEENPGIVCGQSVHRDEFGISKGTFWSPSGRLLAFYRMDESMVTDYPILNLSKQPAVTTMIKYPMAGGVSHEVTIGIYNAESGTTVYLKTGEPKEQYLTNISWSPDNRSIYVVIVNREQDHLWVKRYDAATGSFDKTLFEETDSKYVHPMNPLLFVPGHDDMFIWQSDLVTKSNPEGANTLYLYTTNGKLISELSFTPGDPKKEKKALPEIHVVNVYGFDKNGLWVYFQASPLGTCEKYIYAASTDPKKPELKKLTPETGTHNGLFSDDKRFFVDDYSSPGVPRLQRLYEAGGKQLSTLLTAADPLAAFKKCAVRLFTIPAADNQTPLWCRMILPADFDSTKKYPAFTYVYNGPNAQLISNSWLGGADLFLYYMAQQGFVVFTIDGRGSGNRGSKFEQATFRHLGTQEIADQEKGAQFLQAQSFVDTRRLAVYGWSYGGFMTTSLMTRKPGLYKVGVAGGAVTDWSYYEVMYTERYMDTPQKNPEGYKESNTLNYIENLQGKLLMVHGTADDVVVWQHTLLYTKACVDKGVQTDYYMYPGHPHNVRGKDRIHLLTKVSQYVIANI